MVQRGKMVKTFLYVGGAGLITASSFGKYFPFGLRAGLIILGVIMTFSALFALGLYFSTYMEERQKIQGKNDRHVEPLFRKRDINTGIGWELNFENPYATPLLIFTVGIVPAVGLSILNESVYPLLIFAFLLALPFIIRKFTKPPNSN